MGVASTATVFARALPADPAACAETGAATEAVLAAST
jgi:hypothetical protein